MYLCMWGKRNGVHIYNLHTLEFVHKYRIYQIKWWAVTLLMYEQKSHSIDCTLWTVCMHMCVHLWTVDMYKCMQVDLLSKQSFHAFDWEHLYSRQMVEYARVFLCGTLVDSVARLSFSFLFLFPPICNLWEAVLIEKSHKLASARLFCYYCVWVIKLSIFFLIENFLC